ncbi:swr complex subunit [Zalaria obscura]|uniref:Swr complex subunit n=1 Tax=Zalaria obscura TaxID=2024903 RepID=A0ACC3SIR2_9PEZI
MSAQDMRDVLGLPGDGARPPPLKKQKTVEKRPLEKGMAREVSALMGERAPPLSMIQVQPKYKQRPKRQHKVTPWEWAPFKNQARDDGLTLHHWQRKQPPKPAPVTDVSQDGEAAPVEDQKPEQKEKGYQFAKFNVPVEVPTYTPELYDAQLQDPDWTKEETDYLITLVKDFGQKWAVVTDRYDYQSTTEQPAKPRTMEDLKARYYTVSARVLAHNIPISSMTGSQYSLYSLLTSFNPVQETSRKRLAEGHLHRTQAEVDEESTLLSELQRIMAYQSTLEAERADLRHRLDYPIATSSTATGLAGVGGAGYSTSAALAQLFQQLLAQDRLKKDRRLKAPGEGPAGQTPGGQASGAAGHRDSLAAGSSTSARKAPGGRDSISGPSDRALSPRSSNRYFVTHHDRLSAGVQFASDKLSKPRVAKSAIQTERIAAVLQHLQIPEVIGLPTQRVVEEFERLMAGVGTLLELRKVAEKEESEIRVREAEKGIRSEGEGKVKKEEVEVEVDVDVEGEGEGERGTKRDASHVSEGGEESNKRTKT